MTPERATTVLHTYNERYRAVLQKQWAYYSELWQQLETQPDRAGYFDRLRRRVAAHLADLEARLDESRAGAPTGAWWGTEPTTPVNS